MGAFCIGKREQGPFDEEDLELLRQVTDQLAIAIRQARLNAQVRNYATELEGRVAERTAELKERNRELETFAYSVSHDLKAPLRGIDGYSRLLSAEYGEQLDDNGRLYVDSICQAVGLMSQLIDDLLAYSRLQRRELVWDQVDLPAMVEQLLAERRQVIEDRGVQVAVDLCCETLNAEGEGMRQALRNLLDNALKFSGEQEEPCIEIGSKQDSDICSVWVRDNGIGFDMKYQERIFEIFQRLHRAEEYPGTGIGLALVAKAMQRVGGRVWAESVPGAGATFYLEIPQSR